MVSEKDKNVYQLAHYFVMNYAYKFIEVPGNRHEIWLGSNEVVQYPIIRITSTPVNSTFFDKPRLNANYTAIAKFLHVDAKLLDIHINDGEIDSFEDDIVQVAIKDNKIEGTDIQNTFPTILQYAQMEERNQLSSEEKLRAMSQKQKKTFKEYATVTNIIIVICIAVFLFANYIAYLMGGGSEALVNAAIVVGGYYKTFIVAGGEYFRFLTAGFVHIQLLHLMMNMIAFKNLGSLLERVYTQKQYLAILLVSIITGSLLVFVAQGNTVVVGLSGGLYGLLGAYVVFAFDSKAIRNPQVFKGIMYTLGINLMISFLPNVSLYGHLGGFVGGFFLALAFSKNKEWKSVKRNAFLALILLVSGIGVKIAKGVVVTPIYYGTDMQVLKFLDSAGLNSYTRSMAQKLNDFYGYNLK